MASDNVLKLTKRLLDEFNIIVNPNSYYTTRASKHQRAGGSYLWIFSLEHPRSGFVGGCEPMSKYLPKRNKLEISIRYYGTDIEVFAYAPGEPGYDLQ